MKAPIFIIGCERSGTTLFRAMLDSHPDLAIPFEANRFSGILGLDSVWNCEWNKSEIRDVILRFLQDERVAF